MRQWCCVRGAWLRCRHTASRDGGTVLASIHQASRDAGWAGPADAVLTDRFAVSMTADVETQRGAVLSSLQARREKSDRRLSGWDRGTSRTRLTGSLHG